MRDGGEMAIKRSLHPGKPLPDIMFHFQGFPYPGKEESAEIHNSLASEALLFIVGV